MVFEKASHLFLYIIPTYFYRAQSYSTALKADLCQDINSGFASALMELFLENVLH